MRSYYNRKNPRYYKKANFQRKWSNKNYDSTYGQWKNYYYTNYCAPKFIPKFQFFPYYIPPYFDEYSLQRKIIDRAQKYISWKYPELLPLNYRNAKYAEKINENCKFFIIKSLTEEDIHKSIKYNVWCSSKTGNIVLNDAYNAAKEKNADVYLIFTCNGTERYDGIAKMKSNFDEKRQFDLWTQDNVWIGLFDVEWVFIKDVPYKEFRNAIITMNNGEMKPIYQAKDGQEIPYEQGKIMIEKFDKYIYSNTILEHFEYYDLRQESYEKNIKKKEIQSQIPEINVNDIKNNNK